jgi:restriction endonuclease Mrr
VNPGFGALVGRGEVTNGVFITTLVFTDAAKAYIEKVGDKKIILIDGKN